MNTEARRKFLIDFAFFAVIAGIIYVVFEFLSVYLLPFVIGIAVSFLVQRPVRAIHKKTRVSKGMITVIFVIFTYFAILAAVGLVGFLLYRWLSDLARLLPGILPTISETISEMNASLTQVLKDMPETVVTFLNGVPEKLIGGITTGITSLLSSAAKGAATGAPALLVSVIVTVVASCYIAKDYDVIICFAHRHVPKKAWDILIDIKELFVQNIFKILKGYLLLMLITFVELAIGLWITGQSNFIMLAAIICVVDILPVLGTGTVLIPWAVVSLISGNIWNSVGLLVLYAVITVIRNFLEPKIIGQQVGLHPLITLLSMFCGYKLIGFMGLFLFPLTLIILNDLYKHGKIKLFKEPDAPTENTQPPGPEQPSQTE